MAKKKKPKVALENDEAIVYESDLVSESELEGENAGQGPAKKEIAKGPKKQEELKADSDNYESHPKFAKFKK
jgi:hypothetical protein